MPIIRVTGETADGYIVGANAVYATARSTSTGSGSADVATVVGQDNIPMSVYRAYFSFDTSSLSMPSDAVLTSASLHLKAQGDDSTADFLFQCYRYAWAETIAANREANYDGAYGLSATLEGTFRDTASGFVADTWYSMDVDPAGINTSGDTKYVLVSKEDVDNSQPVADEYVEFWCADSAGNEPYLLIEWQPAGELSRTADMRAVKVEPWHRVGPLTLSTVLKTGPGWLGGVRVTATDTDGDVVVNLWDSPDSTTTSDVELARLSLGKTAKDVREVTFPDPGVELENGLYVEISGTCETELWLR